MSTKQQEETLLHFKEHAKHWGKKGLINSRSEVNVIKQRNDFVLKTIASRTKTDLVLDMGCGTGDLVCEIASKGIDAIGVDFAEEMIRIAKRKARQMKCDRAKFECCSIFDFIFEDNRYDLISANGLIEYISYAELDRLLAQLGKALKRGGSLVLGSRNRLFNIFSLNEYTKNEIKDDRISDLLLEAVQITNAKNITALEDLPGAPLQKEKQIHHHDAEMKIATRYQYTPVQLINILKNKSLKPVEIFPIHIHGVPPRFKALKPDIHAHISNFLQAYAKNNLSLIPQASSFMIHAKKIR